MNHHESKLQATCVRWFRYNFPRMILHSIPNGGKRTITTARVMKLEGQLPGVPDLFLAHPCGTWHGMYIEMKYGKNTTSEAQELLIARLMDVGYQVVICRTFDDFRMAIEKYLTP